MKSYTKAELEFIGSQKPEFRYKTPPTLDSVIVE
tara:strand:- start:574 stop:675 length:102 start_codon:yes stop_codon:yes gene_type:complete